MINARALMPAGSRTTKEAPRKFQEVIRKIIGSSRKQAAQHRRKAGIQRRKKRFLMWSRRRVKERKKPA